MTFQYFILIGLFQNGPERCLTVLKPLVVSKQAVECSDSVVWNRHNFTSKLPAIILFIVLRRHHVVIIIVIVTVIIIIIVLV